MPTRMPVFTVLSGNRTDSSAVTSVERYTESRQLNDGLECEMYRLTFGTESDYWRTASNPPE